VGGLTFFTDVVKSRVHENGAVTQIDLREVKPGVSTDHMKQAMGALSFISWALRKHPPQISTKLFLDLPEDIDEEVRGCFEALGVEICVWPDMPTSVAAAPPQESGGEEGEPAAALPVFQTRVQQGVMGGDMRNAGDWVFQDLGLDQSGNLCCIGKVGDALYHTREDLTRASVRALPEGAACVPFCFCIQVPGSQPVIFAAASSAARELWMQELASVAKMPSA